MGINQFIARHTRSTYLGHVAEHLFHAARDTPITVQEHRPRPRTWDGPVRLGFDAADVALLTE
jgi:hypothetical protein